MMPTEATVPFRASVLASVVMLTDCPALRLARSDAPTVPSTFHFEVAMIANWVVLDAEESRELFEPEEAEEPTVSPTSRPTLATVPLIGERRTAFFRSSCALVRAALAERT
jgi:hypothetical protein